MAERKILQLGVPLLWERSRDVADVKGASVRGVIQDLDDTLAWFRATTGWGRGISAPQIGELLRISFIHVDDVLSRESRLMSESETPLHSHERLVLINPEIVWRSKETFTLWDDCFSFPNLLVKVSRQEAIEVTYTDPRGKPQRLRAERGLSELLQHEIDHLEGILALDRRLNDHSVATREAFAQMEMTPHPSGATQVWKHQPEGAISQAASLNPSSARRPRLRISQNLRHLWTKYISRR
ncbi:MAG: peptide deformylase [Acidobacteriia bacterium]|nr:peptide deformylase [Terriglobia bacterium]